MWNIIQVKPIDVMHKKYENTLHVEKLTQTKNSKGV